MNKLISVFFVLATLILSGCSSNYNSVTQVEDRSVLQLNGNFWGTTLQLDAAEPVKIESNTFNSYTKDGQELLEFPIKPGAHKIEVQRNGKTIVLRKIYVGNGSTFEVIIP